MVQDEEKSGIFLIEARFLMFGGCVIVAASPYPGRDQTSRTCGLTAARKMEDRE